MKVNKRADGGVDVIFDSADAPKMAEEIIRLTVLVADLRRAVEALPRGEFVSSGYAMSDPLIRTPAVSLAMVLNLFPTPGKLPLVAPQEEESK